MNREIITFKYNGEIKIGWILSKDSDPTANIWVVDATNPDIDYFVSPSDIIPTPSAAC